MNFRHLYGGHKTCNLSVSLVRWIRTLGFLVTCRNRVEARPEVTLGKPFLGPRFTTSARQARRKAATFPMQGRRTDGGCQMLSFPGLGQREQGVAVGGGRRQKTSSRPWLVPQLGYILRAIVSLVFGNDDPERRSLPGRSPKTIASKA